MKLIEETISQQEMFKGKLIKVRHDQVMLPNDSIALREVVEHPGGVCIAAEGDDNEFFLVEQYRYAHSMILKEFPAGKLERGEDPLACAKRELNEEIGYASDDLTFLGTFIPTGAYLEEKIYMYYTNTLKFVGQNLDPDEFLQVKKESLDSLLIQVLNGEITDGKTMAMILKISTMKEKHLL